MADDPPPLVNSDTSDAAERSLVEDIRRLVEDGRTLAEAEIAYQKSRAAVAGAGAKGIAGWLALALALLFFTLMALVVGLLLALTPLLGGWGAMAAVTLGLLLCTGLCVAVAGARWKRLSQALSDTEREA